MLEVCCAPYSDAQDIAEDQPDCGDDSCGAEPRGRHNNRPAIERTFLEDTTDISCALPGGIMGGADQRTALDFALGIGFSETVLREVNEAQGASLDSAQDERNLGLTRWW